jgi:hypothetical protein
LAKCNAWSVCAPWPELLPCRPALIRVTCSPDVPRSAGAGAQCERAPAPSSRAWAGGSPACGMWPDVIIAGPRALEQAPRLREVSKISSFSSLSRNAIARHSRDGARLTAEKLPRPIFGQWERICGGGCPGVSAYLTRHGATQDTAGHSSKRRMHCMRKVPRLLLAAEAWTHANPSGYDL